MAEVHSKETVFLTDEADGSTDTDMTQYITSVDGLPGERDLVEKTALGDNGRRYVPGLENEQFTLELNWDEDGSGTPEDVFGPLRTHGDPVGFKYGPAGNDSGNTQISGSYFVRNYVVTSRVASLVTARAECQVDGQVTRGTF